MKGSSIEFQNNGSWSNAVALSACSAGLFPEESEALKEAIRLSKEFEFTNFRVVTNIRYVYNGKEL